MKRNDPNHPEPDRLRDEQWEREHTANVIARGDELSVAVVLDAPDGGEDVHEFDTLAEAKAAGYPIGCQWFAGCEAEATTLVPHPILTAVPTCQRCATRASRLR